MRQPISAKGSKVFREQNQPLFEKVLTDIAGNYERVGVAKIATAFLEMEKTGKPTRDWLANSINHPNDFGVRIYAQVILKTLLEVF